MIVCKVHFVTHGVKLAKLFFCTRHLKLFFFRFTYHHGHLSIFQRQSSDDNAITSEYDLYSDEYDSDSIDREGRAEEGQLLI